MAQSVAGRRERKIARTSAALTELARRWTATRGFADFTVEELCEAVDISRRTFFNYFASKEDAVLGLPTRTDHSAAETTFVTAGLHSGHTLSATLITDLAELMVHRWEDLGLGAHDLAALADAVEQAPRLLVRLQALTRQAELADTALVERREGLERGDLRAATAVHLLGSMLRSAIEETLSGDVGEPLRVVFNRRLDAARTVFAGSPSSRTERIS